MTSDGPDTTLNVSDSGVLRIPPRLRERYLTEHVDSCMVQPSGMELRIWIWSDRKDLLLEIPLEEVHVGDAYERSISRWGINVNRWMEGQPRMQIGFGGKSGCLMVEATVTPFEREANVN